VKRIQTLGGLAVFADGRPLAGSSQQPRRLAVVAVLARGGSRGVSRDRLVTLLWPDTEEERGRRSLNQALYALRQELGSEATILGTRELRLNPELVETDIGEFEAASASGAPEEAARLYGGPFLGDFTLPGAPEFTRWADEEREALNGDYRRVLEAVARAAGGRGDWGAAVLWWRRLASHDRSSAEVAQSLMRALAAAGDVPGAVRHAEIFTALRQQELDLPADPDVLALAERIRRGELPPPARRSTPHQLPQPGSHSPAADTKPTVPRTTEPPSIVVLPFVNMSPDRENEYFSDGLTEELTNALTQVAGLRVASRTSAYTFKGNEVDAREIGSRLGVTLLVEGSVRKIGNRIRVTAQMVCAADGYRLWSQAYDRTLTDVFALQEEVALAVVAALSLQGYGLERPPPIRPPTRVIEAYTLYLRGRYFVIKGDTESFRVGLEYFDQALELDPEYALAHAGVAQCWAMRGFEEFGDLAPLEAMPKAKAAADRALALDPQLPEGYAWRGIIALLFDYDPAEAEARLTRAIELQPSTIAARLWLAILRSTSGRHEEAIAEALQAERLDPVAIRVQFVLGRCYYWAGRFEEAMRRFQTVLGMDPDSLACGWVARVFVATGRADLGLHTVETAMARLGRHPLLLETQGMCLARLDRTNEARRVIAELEGLARMRYITPSLATTIHAHLGEEEAAMRCLEEAARQRSGFVVMAPLMPGGESLRQTPRYQALMQRLGLAGAGLGAGDDH
jgi:adenylate cyclase